MLMASGLETRRCRGLSTLTPAGWCAPVNGAWNEDSRAYLDAEGGRELLLGGGEKGEHLRRVHVGQAPSENSGAARGRNACLEATSVCSQASAQPLGTALPITSDTQPPETATAVLTRLPDPSTPGSISLLYMHRASLSARHLRTRFRETRNRSAFVAMAAGAQEGKERRG
ncbi:hypothetical protein T484DRAFT_2854150 [Baffinella frigidus]|nr:hypothetical protein T484DRAFT_2854150 [Cryptophyta sp. CCMP2293]